MLLRSLIENKTIIVVPSRLSRHWTIRTAGLSDIVYFLFRLLFRDLGNIIFCSGGSGSDVIFALI